MTHSGPTLDRALDDRVRADLDVGRQRRLGVDDSRRVDQVRKGERHQQTPFAPPDERTSSPLMVIGITASQNREITLDEFVHPTLRTLDTMLASDQAISIVAWLWTLSISARQSLQSLPRKTSREPDRLLDWSRPPRRRRSTLRRRSRLDRRLPRLGRSTVPSGRITDSGMARWPSPARLANSNASVARSR